MANRVNYVGVTFGRVRAVLFNMYFYYQGMPEAEAEETLEKYVVPMQHNFENPLQGDNAKDTFIEFWIARDERVTQDFSEATVGGGENAIWRKLATVDLRFVGCEAETWAKAFHHIAQRDQVALAFFELCQGRVLEGIGDIVPVNIDYYGVGNSSIAFDLSIKIEYKESIELTWKPLEYISLAPGEIIEGGISSQ
jgi:hypothetical protein